jgi:uncharacterized protein YoxC
VEVFLVIAQILALLCVSALCIYLIVVLSHVKGALTNFEKDVKEMTSLSLPVLENMEFITSRVRSISENVDDQVIIVRQSLGSIKEIADNVVALERKVQERIEGPILETVAVISAIFKGIRTFVERVRA